MSAFLTALIGLLVGAFIQRTHSRHERMEDRAALAVGLLVELDSFAEQDRVMNEHFIVPTLDRMMANGIVEFPELYREVFSEEPHTRFPFYYQALGQLGNLPREASLPLMRYHSLRTAGLKTAQQLVAREMDIPTVKSTASALRQILNDAIAQKVLAMAELRKIETRRSAKILPTFRSKSPDI